MCNQEDKVGGYCVLEAVLAYTMGWWQQNEVGVWGQGRRGRHLLEQPESCIINSHPVVLSVSNPTGIKRTMHGQLHCTIVPRMFSLCFIYMIAHYHLCKALCLFSAHDKQPSVNETTDCTHYSAVTSDCSILHFLWKMHSNPSSNTKAFLFMS